MGCEYLKKTLVIKKLGIPDQRGGKVTKPKLYPLVAYPRGLR